MPKLIFTSRYLQNALPAQPENYVRYIGTREGIDFFHGRRYNGGDDTKK
ncbi:MAG: hypothetical protein LIO67_01515 [Lachnospiraceae bacterium]|nr:hypothetical protein [Lachnospiraceae bacterium]